MNEILQSILSAFAINLLLTLYSLKSYNYLICIGWDKFIRRLGIAIAVKFVLLLILTLLASLFVQLANIYFVLSFSIFMLMQLTIEIWYLVRISKRIKE